MLEWNDLVLDSNDKKEEKEKMKNDWGNGEYFLNAVITQARVNKWLNPKR